MSILSFNRKNTKKPAVEKSTEPVWAGLKITEAHIRELVSLRIQFLDKTQGKHVSPDEPDLSGLLEEFCKDVETRMVLMLIWHEEVKKFYDQAVSEASKVEFSERIKKNMRTKKA